MKCDETKWKISIKANALACKSNAYACCEDKNSSRHDCLADKNSYRHDLPADKKLYLHDRHCQIIMVAELVHTCNIHVVSLTEHH